MSLLILGLIVFFAVHSIAIVSPAGRDRLAQRLGEGPYKGLFSLVSLGGLVLVIYGYGLARMDPVLIYTPPMWLRHLAMLLLVPVFPLLLATYLPGRIRTAVRHPMLIAVKLWALAHLLANGTLADVLLFGSFLGWAVADRISLKSRPTRTHPTLPGSALNDAIAIIGGLALYVVFVLWLHRWLIGVAPVAMG